MFHLIRQHHSFYLTDQTQYEEFLHLAQQHCHMSTLLMSLEEELLLSWRVVYNLWQYLVTEDKRLIVNPEMRMIYPTTDFILEQLRQMPVVSRFRKHYFRDRDMMFYAAIFMANSMFYWYVGKYEGEFKEKTYMQLYLSSDFYLLFQEQKKTEVGYPAEFVKGQALFLKALTQAILEDQVEIQQVMASAIEETKQCFYYFQQDQAF